MQQVLDLNFDYTLPVLNREQQKQRLYDHAKFAGTFELLRFDNIRLRPRQFVILEELQRRRKERISKKLPKENLLIEAGTGIGKTFVFIDSAMSSVANDRVAILVTTENKLVKQAEKKILLQTLLGEFDVLTLSGKIAPWKRSILLQSRPKIIITTPGVMLEDFRHYEWDKIDYIMFDECQNLVGDASAMLLAKKLKEKKKELRKSDLDNTFSTSGMSATVASNEKNLRLLMLALDIDKIITVSNPNDMREGGKEKIKDFPITLDKLSKRILNNLKLSICGLMDYVRTALDAPSLFPIQSDVDFWLPFFADRDIVRTKLKKLEETLAEEPDQEDVKVKKEKEQEKQRLQVLRMSLSELEFYCDLHFRLNSLGMFAFLEKYCYARCQLLFKQDKRRTNLRLPEMTSDKTERFLSRGKIKGLRNQELRRLVFQAAKLTPYAEIVLADSWAVLRNKISGIDFRVILGPFSVNTKRRRVITKKRNEYLLKRSQGKRSKYSPEEASDVALLREYFNYAMGFMAKREKSDHEKEPELLNQLNLIREIIPNVTGFIFTPLTRHSEFLSERLEIRCSSPIMRPIAAHGSMGSGMNDFRSEALDGFNKAKFNFLVTTVAFAGTGIDVENATIGIHYALSNSNHIQFLQANGRVLGRAKIPILLLFYSKGSQQIERKRFHSAVSKEVKRRKLILKKAMVLEPNFEIEEEVSVQS